MISSHFLMLLLRKSSWKVSSLDLRESWPSPGLHDVIPGWIPSQRLGWSTYRANQINQRHSQVDMRWTKHGQILPYSHPHSKKNLWDNGQLKLFHMFFHTLNDVLFKQHLSQNGPTVWAQALCYHLCRFSVLRGEACSQRKIYNTWAVRCRSRCEHHRPYSQAPHKWCVGLKKRIV